MKHDYPAQFRNADGSLNLNKFNPIRYFTARYDQTGPQWTQYMTDPYDELTFASRQAMREVHGRWEGALLANSNANNLATLVNDCLANAPTYCASTWAAQTFFNSYDETALEF
jgi:hypothetical protein